MSTGTVGWSRTWPQVNRKATALCPSSTNGWVSRYSCRVVRAGKSLSRGWTFCVWHSWLSCCGVIRTQKTPSSRWVGSGWEGGRSEPTGPQGSPLPRLPMKVCCHSLEICWCFNWAAAEASPSPLFSYQHQATIFWRGGQSVQPQQLHRLLWGGHDRSHGWVTRCSVTGHVQELRTVLEL